MHFMNSYTSWFTKGKSLLLKSVTWGICTASRPYARDRVFQIPTGSYYTSVSEEDQSQDSLISKLLRWVAASVILEKVLESLKTLFSPEIKNARTLQALLENVERSVKFQTSRVTFYRYFSLC
ncbi:hypothetical protein Syun_018346 [Stephania yunnanensis]|uniref:Uncharacterized protein n=1 Tax=Stephania yunnanensis TaxID=152371 RepID=A0AAP0NW84_9MAGN